MKPKKPIFTIIRRRKPPLGRRCHTHFWLRRCRHLRSQRSTFSLLRWRHHDRRTCRPGGPGRRCGVGRGLPADGLARISCRWWTSLVDGARTHPSRPSGLSANPSLFPAGPRLRAVTRIGRVLAINTLKNLNDTLAVPLPASVAATAAISTGSPEEASGPRSG